VAAELTALAKLSGCHGLIHAHPMPTPRRRDGEPVQVRTLGRLARDDDTPGLAELVARAAENDQPPGCPLCEGPDAWGRAHDPACPLA
jgi:hypothetical protein